ncbi:MAG: aminotransferase class V-fold PLP-dependent enzyme [Verrucomicrobiota bacterium]
MLYLDHNATAPLSELAHNVWLETHTKYPANPASQHRLGQRADVALEGAREELAGLMGTKASALIWTSGATEAANTVMFELAKRGASNQKIWVSAIEHPCVLESAERWFPDRVIRLEVTSQGVLDVEKFRARLEKSKPVAVLLMAANNETGVLQPWREVSEICRLNGVWMVCDATQWMGRLSAGGLGGCDFVFGSGHKCGGPVGVGFLKIPGSWGGAFEGLLVGGGQEEGRRAGTQNLAGVLAMVAVFKVAETFQEGVVDRFNVRREIEDEILRIVPGASIVGSGVERLWNTVCVTLPELGDCRQRWVVRMDAAGVAVSTGSACASGKEKGSHVLGAMGVSEGERGRTLRWSGGWQTTREQWMEAVRVLKQVWVRFGVS